MSLHTLADVRTRCLVKPGGCWEWQGAYTVNGRKANSRLPYTWYPAEGRTISVLRLVLLMRGREPGAVVWRTCTNFRCCNPAHLRTGTKAQQGEWSAARGHLTGRHNRNSAKLTEELAQWAVESPQLGVDVAHALDVSPTTVGRARMGRTWKPAPPPVTRVPSGTDKRYTPEVVEPFFSAGKRLQSDSAIARAYGG